MKKLKIKSMSLIKREQVLENLEDVKNTSEAETKKRKK